ncbi:MAG: hypothetical protein HYS09_00190 [Chloroflexi bacterium]|nr:hypothetical protein [Chloroflexota bacterium]
MYGSVFRIKPKAGKEQDVIRMMEEWNRERRPKVRGALGGYLYKLDNGGMMAVAMFESKEAYVANAEDPGQDQWYRQFRDLLEADPEWNDGEVVVRG